MQNVLEFSLKMHARFSYFRTQNKQILSDFCSGMELVCATMTTYKYSDLIEYFQ